MASIHREQAQAPQQQATRKRWTKMMRIAKAYNPVIEIQQALDCVNEKGYCWWGSAKNAVFADEILIFQVGNSNFAFGVLEAVEIREKEEIDQNDFEYYRPKSWSNEQIYGRYYKIKGGYVERIPRSEIIRENGNPLRPTDLRTNVKVSLI